MEGVAFISDLLQRQRRFYVIAEPLQVLDRFYDLLGQKLCFSSDLRNAQYSLASTHPSVDLDHFFKRSYLKPRRVRVMAPNA